MDPDRLALNLEFHLLGQFLVVLNNEIGFLTIAFGRQGQREKYGDATFGASAFLSSLVTHLAAMIPSITRSNDAPKIAISAFSATIIRVVM